MSAPCRAAALKFSIPCASPPHHLRPQKSAAACGSKSPAPRTKWSLRSNATMLFGHVETLEERVDHLILLREAQDETHGFVTFIPLEFHPANTALAHVPKPTGFDDLKTIAVSRLMLDNFDHIKGLLDHAHSAHSASPAHSLWRERSRRHGGRGKKLPRRPALQLPEGLTRSELERLIRRRGVYPGRARHSLQSG